MPCSRRSPACSCCWPASRPRLLGQPGAAAPAEPLALRRIILPLIAPAILYTMLWVGLLSLREVSMALFLQRPQNTVLSTQIWTYWMSTKPAEAAALGTMLIVVVAAGFIVLLQVAGRQVYRR